MAMKKLLRPLALRLSRRLYAVAKWLDWHTAYPVPIEHQEVTDEEWEAMEATWR